MSFQEEWERKKEERQRKRMEQEAAIANGSDSTSPTKSSRMTIPGVQLKQTPKSQSSPVSNGHQVNEAERKAEELRLKREQERLDAERRASAERQKTTVLTLTPERKEEIRRAREERERQEKQQEEERKARAEEEAQRVRDEIQRRRQEAEARRKRAQEGGQDDDVAYTIPKYNIAASIAKAKQEKHQSSAELKEERERVVAERVPQLRISAHDSMERLQEIAIMLHAQLQTTYGDIFDLEQRKTRQDYDRNELNERLKDLTKIKTVNVTTIDQGRVSMLKERGFMVEDKAKSKPVLDTKASMPTVGSIQDKLQQLQNNLKKDQEVREKNLKKEPIKKVYSTPEKLKEEIETSKKEVERLRQQREENRKQREEEIKRLERLEEERKKKAEEERRQRQEEQEKLRREKKEREEKEAARKVLSMMSGKPLSIAKVVSQQKAKNREETLAERVPPLQISNTTSDVELRNIANDLHNRLKTTFGEIFDLEEKKKKNEYYKNELNERVGYLKTSKSPAIVSTGIVSKMKDGGWAAKKQNSLSKSPKPKELGGMSSEGGVRNRMAMFTGGGTVTDSPKGPAPAKINIYK